MGIFPWFENDNELFWWSPDPRMVLFPEKLRISKSTKKNFKEIIHFKLHSTSLLWKLSMPVQKLKGLDKMVLG